MTAKLSKRRFNIPGLALLLAILLLISACGRKSPEVVDTAPPAAEGAAVTEAGNALLKNRFADGIDALRLKNYGQARRIFSEIIRQNSKLSGPYANLALIDFRQQDYASAMQQVNRSLGLNPQNAQAFHLRAQLQLQKGEIKLARQDYEKALALEPEYLNAHYNLALLYDIYLQEIALAIEHYSIYLTLLGEEDETLQDWIRHLRSTLENG